MARWSGDQGLNSPRTYVQVQPFTGRFGCRIGRCCRAETEQKEQEATHEIRVAGPGEVIITQGWGPELTIEAERNLLPYMRSDVDAGVLTLGFREPGPSIHSTKQIRLYLNVGDISKVEILGSANVIADGLATSELRPSLVGSGDVHSDGISVQELYIHVVGSGNVEIDSLEARLVEANVTGSGDVRLLGEAESLQVAILESGNYIALELCAPAAKVVILGSGDAYVCASDALQISVPGSGHVFYSGSPSLDVWDIGAGDVRRDQ
jgi:hypothetical protein